MAATKTKPNKAKAKKTRSATKPKSRPASKAKSKAKAKSTSKPQAVLSSVEETAKDAGGAVGNAAGKVGQAASKAKVPLMASGAALVGAAGGLALARNGHRRHGVAGVRSKDLAKAARQAGNAGLRVADLALEGRRAREASNGNGGSHRSPVEVVLDGLTSRR